MFDNFRAAVARYTGYTRFVVPFWDAYTGWLVAHPNTTGGVIIALFVIGLRF